MLFRSGGTLLKPLFRKPLITDIRQYLHQTHYDVLGLPRNCSTKDVKEAFIKLSKRYHPDTNTTKSSHNQFIKVLEAYNVLSKPGSRRIYDWELTQGSFQSFNDFEPARKSRRTRTRGYAYDDPSFWANRQKYNNNYDHENAYYGVPGVRRVSNGIIAVICLLFTAIGCGLQYLAIRHSMTLRRDIMVQQSLENEEILAQIQEEAQKNGNELQIELMERRLLKNRFYTQFDMKEQ